MLNTDLLEFAKQNAGLTGLVILVLLTIFYNLPKLVDSFGYLRSVKIRRLENAMSSEFVDEISKLIIKEELSKIYFERSLGIKANEETKKYALELQKDLRGNFTLVEILKTTRYLPDKLQLLSSRVLEDKLYEINELTSFVRKNAYITYLIPILSVLTILTTIYTAYTTDTFISYDFIGLMIMSLYFSAISIYFIFSEIRKKSELTTAANILQFYISSKEERE